MISMLKGVVERISGNCVTLNVHDVGYEVICSQDCISDISEGNDIRIVVHTDVKEDSIRLYGFKDEVERQVFLLLTKVKGIGAKSASEIVSKIDKRELLRAIGSGDLQKLQSVRGIGKKTAERLVVELKDRVINLTSEQESRGIILEKEVHRPVSEALEALQALGFSRKEAEKAVREVELLGLAPSMPSGEIVKQALRFV